MTNIYKNCNRDNTGWRISNLLCIREQISTCTSLWFHNYSRGTLIQSNAAISWQRCRKITLTPDRMIETKEPSAQYAMYGRRVCFLTHREDQEHHREKYKTIKKKLMQSWDKIIEKIFNKWAEVQSSNRYLPTASWTVSPHVIFIGKKNNTW